MERQIRIIGTKRKAMDEEKLALAFLMLAKALHEQKQAEAESEPRKDAEAA